MAISDGFRDYPRIRRYLENIYLFGFFGREEFKNREHCSDRDYDVVIKLLNELYPEMSASFTDRRKYHHIERRYENSGQNRMADSYMLCAIDEDTYLVEYLRLLSALRLGPMDRTFLPNALVLPGSDEEKALGEDLTGELPKQIQKQRSNLYQRARSRADDLVHYGYVQVYNKRVYQLHRERLPADQLEQLYDYVCFASNITYPRVAGSFLRRTLKREMLSSGIELSDVFPFILRHNTSHNIFAEDLVYQVLEAISYRKWIRIGTQKLLPIELRPECRLGRWYVLVWDPEKQCPDIKRLSWLEDLKIIDEEVEGSLWLELHQKVTGAYRCSLYSSRLTEQPILVKVKLLFGSQKGLQRQFIREIRIGEVVKEQGDLYYQALINDPVELMPLLRAYSPWLKVLPGSHDLNERLHDSLLQMKNALEEAYGTAE